MLFRCLIFIIFISYLNCEIKKINDGNWKQISEKEWMILLYAPWCPACQQVKPEWERFSQSIQESHHINIGSIDITENPIVAGSFLVSRLPTFYHVKDGLFRQYSGDRSIGSLLQFVNEKMYLDVEPLPWYYSPSSVHMRLLGRLFQLSQFILKIQEKMSSTYGWPSWLTYVTIGSVIVFLGVAMSMIFMCVCDMLIPPRPQLKQYWSKETLRTKPIINKETDPDRDDFPDMPEISLVEKDFGQITLDDWEDKKTQ